MKILNIKKALAAVMVGMIMIQSMTTAFAASTKDIDIGSGISYENQSVASKYGGYRFWFRCRALEKDESNNEAVDHSQRVSGIVDIVFATPMIPNHKVESSDIDIGSGRVEDESENSLSYFLYVKNINYKPEYAYGRYYYSDFVDVLEGFGDTVKFETNIVTKNTEYEKYSDISLNNVGLWALGERENGNYKSENVLKICAMMEAQDPLNCQVEELYKNYMLGNYELVIEDTMYIVPYNNEGEALRYEGKPFVLYGTKSEIIGTLERHGIFNEQNKAQIEANVIVKEDSAGQSFFGKVYKDGQTQYVFVRSSDRYTLVTMPGSKVLRDQWLEKYEDSQPKDVRSLALMET